MESFHSKCHRLPSTDSGSGAAFSLQICRALESSSEIDEKVQSKQTPEKSFINIYKKEEVSNKYLTFELDIFENATAWLSPDRWRELSVFQLVLRLIF